MLLYVDPSQTTFLIQLVAGIIISIPLIIPIIFGVGYAIYKILQNRKDR